jgi:YVTN family beta-propeller protein
MKVAAVLLAVCCWLSAARCQYLETTILLPDTLGPLNGPYCLAWDDNPAHPRLYIGGEGDSGGVIVAEAITCKRLARVSTGPVKALCFVAPHGKLYVANAGSDTIKVVDCSTNQVVSEVRIASEAPVLQYNHLNDRLYCGGSSVSALDCAGDTLVHTILVAATVFELDSVDNKLYAGTAGPLSVIDCDGDSVAATVAGVDSAGALCFNPMAGKVYVASGDTLYAIQTSGDSIVARLPFGGLSPLLACDLERNRLHCAYGGNLGSIDCAADTVVLTTYTGVVPYALACNAARDLVYLALYGEVGVFNGTTGQVVTWITTQSSSGCGWSSSLDRLFCPPALHEEPPVQLCLFTTIDGSGDTLAGFLPLTLYASSLTLDTVHNRLYFVYPSLLSGCIGAVDCSRNTVTWYKYAAGAEAVCYNPNNDRLYWGIYDYYTGLSVVTVYDCAAESVVKRIPVNGRVHALRLHKGLNKLYAETWNPGLCIIDCKYDTLLAYIPWPDNYPRIQFLVPEDNRYWYLGPGGVIVVDCVGDTIVANVQDHIGSIDDACACSQERKIYTWDRLVIDMDRPEQVDSVEFWGNRFCYVPGEHKLYGCTNDDYHPYFLVLDTRSDTVTRRFSSPCMVSGMCLDRTGEYIYCAGYEDSMMLVISVRDDSIVATFRVTTIAAARDPLAANRLTNRIYEAQYFVYSGSGIPVVRDSLLIGLEELAQTECGPGVSPTVVNRNAPLRASTSADLYNASGRKTAVLEPGLNDISRLTPGVYFVRETRVQAQSQTARKLVVTR